MAIQRKARPLKRDQKYRDDRLFVIACDDCDAPEQYFGLFRLPRVHVVVIPTSDGTSSAAHVLRRLNEYRADPKLEFLPDDVFWLVLDTDHYTQRTHLRSFTSALTQAKQQGVNVALSKPCFELWLLLHHTTEDTVGGLRNAREVVRALRNLLGGYSKTNIKAEHFSEASVIAACTRARRLDAQVPGGEIPQQNTSRVYKIWDEILGNLPSDQIPVFLRNVRKADEAS